jgi:phenylalanyl-tRNA synthetase beta chain
MKISRNWMNLFGGQGLSLPTDELVNKIGAQLGAVEEVSETGSKYNGVVVAWVVSCVDHPDADRLHVCKIDDGGVVADVKRDDNGHVEVVCGAQNVHADMFVAWLPPGSTVPSSPASDPFVLEARELRGVISNGMIASPKELAISDDHDGILEIIPAEVSEALAKPGMPFKALYGLDDVVIDIENKMFTHRPDCFGQLGVAREIAGIQGLEFSSPDWYLRPVPPKSHHSNDVKEVIVTNEVPELSPRYMLLAMDNITIAPSPVWLQTYLTRVGVRPINNIVDMTNYMMLLTGQPLHAFDFDKVAHDGKAHIVVRNPHEGETLGLLDGRTIAPRSDAILICDQDKPIGLGGIMGGNNSEIDENTKRILIECANFDMYNIRKSSMEHGIFTDAVTRFNKGQSPLQCPAVLYKAAQMVSELSPEAVVVGEILDSKAPLQPVEAVQVNEKFINERLGLKLTAVEMAQLLTNVEFTVDVKHDQLNVTAPFWRTDIAIPEDVVEEVGRLHGFDKLPLELPLRSLVPAQQNPALDFKNRLRNILSRAGANELLTYSFVHGNLLDGAAQDKSQAFELSNALSPDLQYYRLSLTPSLLDKVQPNLKSGIDELAIFELNKAHSKKYVDRDDNLPKEFNLVALVVARKEDSEAGAGFYDARHYLDYLASQLGLKLSYTATESEPDFPAAKPYDHERSALVSDDASGQLLGIVGEYKAAVRSRLKLPVATAGFELDLDALMAVTNGKKYQPLPRFPKVSQDMTLRVPSDVAYGGLADLLQNELDAAKPAQTIARLEPLDVYQKDKDDEHKNVSFHLEIASYERTLTAEEVNSLLDKIAASAHKVLRAERI